jgi:hypothetical protein
VDSSLYRALSATLRTDITEVIEGVRRPLVTEHADALRWPAGNVGRAFDTRWLSSGDAFFTLAGVINRLDRRDLHGEPSCGEVRLIYRLAYRVKAPDGPQSSRLPLTVNAVFVPSQRTECHAVARSWVGLTDGPSLAQQLIDGPLDFSSLVLDRLEINAQVVRFPSGLETEFGGQAIYLLKVYAPSPGGLGLVTQPLENTPDVARIQSSPALRGDLVTWVAEHIADIDRGTYRLPDRFLATGALSYSTLGINRFANKPFSALFEGELRAALPEPAGRLRWIGSRRGLVERLDNGSCTGCHQAGSTAGFHLLGPDDPKLAGVTNRLASPISPTSAPSWTGAADTWRTWPAVGRPSCIGPTAWHRPQSPRATPLSGSTRPAFRTRPGQTFRTMPAGAATRPPVRRSARWWQEIDGQQ